MAERTPEQWKPVFGFEGFYEVSDRGRVRSLHRRRPYVLTPILQSRDRYYVVRLSKHAAGRNRPVHVLVAEAFLGPRPDGQMVRHLDGDRFNNRATNLAWGTARDNTADMIKHGRHNSARKTHCKRGHAFDEANTYHNRKGGRTCRACMRMHEGNRKARLRAENPLELHRPGTHRL